MTSETPSMAAAISLLSKRFILTLSTGNRPLLAQLAHSPTAARSDCTPAKWSISITRPPMNPPAPVTRILPLLVMKGHTNTIHPWKAESLALAIALIDELDGRANVRALNQGLLLSLDYSQKIVDKRPHELLILPLLAGKRYLD